MQTAHPPFSASRGALTEVLLGSAVRSTDELMRALRGNDSGSGAHETGVTSAVGPFSVEADVRGFCCHETESCLTNFFSFRTCRRPVGLLRGRLYALPPSRVAPRFPPCSARPLRGPRQRCSGARHAIPTNTRPAECLAVGSALQPHPCRRSVLTLSSTLCMR